MYPYDMNIKEILSSNIKYYRKGRFTQRKLAEACEIPFPTIRGYENSEGYPSAERLSSIAETLGIEPYQLLETPEQRERRTQTVSDVPENEFDLSDNKPSKYYSEVLERFITVGELKRVLELDYLSFNYEITQDFFNNISEEDKTLWRASLHSIRDDYGYYRYSILRQHFMKFDPSFREGLMWWRQENSLREKSE